MHFGPLDVSEIQGCVLGHTVRLPSGVLKKGRVLSFQDVEALAAAGHDLITVARLDDGDVLEGPAAMRIARALQGEGIRCEDPFTGRVNVHANYAGILEVDVGVAADLLGVDEALTFATLPPGTTVWADQLVATAKVIPFGVPESSLRQFEECSRASEPCVAVRPFKPHAVTFIQTRLPGTAERVLQRASTSMESRLRARGCTLAHEELCAHNASAVAECVARAAADSELIVVLGASQIADRADVVPQGVTEAGGTVHRLGLPMDPGNLTMIASVGTVPVLGVPGCARSARPSGFDRVLDLVLAGDSPAGISVAEFGIGGLLKEISSRPQPRGGPQ